MALEPLYLVAISKHLDLYLQVGKITGFIYFKPDGYDDFYLAYKVKFGDTSYAVGVHDVDGKHFKMLTERSKNRWINNNIKK